MSELKHQGSVQLETERLILRRFIQEDIDDFLDVVKSDKDIVSNMEIDLIANPTREQAQEKIDEILRGYSSDTFYLWAIELKSNKKVVGGVWSIYEKTKEAVDSIRYCINKEYWGNGIMSEALVRVIKFFLEAVGMEVVETSHKNTLSHLDRLMHKVGMRYADDTDGGQRMKFFINKTMYDGDQMPLFFEPVFVERIWGGSRLADMYGFKLPSDKIGEYWAVSAKNGYSGVIANSKHKGKTLEELYKSNREIFGGYTADEFPLLVKIIDAAEDLSVQVHPDDGYANINENGSLGKNECWYILSAGDDAKIVLGHNASDRNEMEKYIKEDRWAELLNETKVQSGDFIMVDSGKVHAIKAGTMLLEIQQSSDVTYRLYDYGRSEASGCKRELHLEKALDVIQFPDNKSEFMPTVKEENGAKITTLVSNKYFTVNKIEVDGIYRCRQDKPFRIICVVGGNGRFNGFFIRNGSIFIVPSTIKEISVEGTLQMIEAYV